MSQFSRRAKWLNQLFTASVAPQSQDPGIVSDDVSLVQPYDGGGIAITPPTFPPEFDSGTGPELITEPFTGIRDYLSGVGITVQTDIFSINEDLVCRLLAVSLFTLAGDGAEFISLNVTPPAQSGISNHQVQYSQTLNTVTNASPRKFARVPPILLPGHQLNMFFNSGTALSAQRISIAMIVAPIGTVFTI